MSAIGVILLSGFFCCCDHANRIGSAWRWWGCDIVTAVAVVTAVIVVIVS